MKLSFLVVAGGLFGGAAWAQAPQVPAAVQAAFAQAQPEATHVAWHQCPAGYEAAFEQRPGAQRLAGEHKYRGTMQFTPAGETVESRLDVPPHALPPLGHTTVSERFPRRQLDRIVRVVNARGEVTYEAKICAGKDKNGKDRNCQTSRFDENGRLLGS